MRAIIVLCLFAAANAAFTNVQSIGQPLVKAAVADFVAELRKGPGLAEYLKVPNNELLMKVEKQTQTELGNQLSEQLSQVLAQIQSAIDHGQMVTQSLIDKAKELFQNLQQIGANTFQLAQQFISELIQLGMLSIGNIFGKRSVSSQVQEILANIHSQWQAAIDKIIAQIQSMINGNTRDMITDLLGGVVNQILGSLDLGSILTGLLGGILGKRDLISDLLGGLLNSILGSLDLSSIPIIGPLLQSILGGSYKRELQDPRIWNLIVDSINSIMSTLGGHFNSFKEWISQIMGQTSTVLQGHMQNIQELAQQVLGHVNELSANTIDQAIEFFRPYHNDLGVLWQQLLDAAAQIHGQITG